MLPGGWKAAARNYAKQGNADMFKPWFDTFIPRGGVPIEAGTIFASPAHADTLTRIAESGAEDFYRGDIAKRIGAFFRKNGGFLTERDLAEFYPEWVEPVSVSYRGYEVWELPPNGQGLVALMALKILGKLKMNGPDEPLDYHRKIEAIKLAFTDGMRHITDPKAMDIPVSVLLSDALADKRRVLMGDCALSPENIPMADHGTVYLCAADGDGGMVSYIQSNYMGFGSGVVIPGTGIAMQNRGANFSLDNNHANCLQPGKRTYHTIIPGFLTKDGDAVGPFGVMGGFMQPQGHVQVISQLLDYGINPQGAIDAYRWQWLSGKKVEAEQGTPPHIVNKLREMGHQVSYAASGGGFGRGQIIFRKKADALAAPMNKYILMGATEPRADGAALGW
jgi:gamma-glutamyltranspeptidase/glutathione hydrolase